MIDALECVVAHVIESVELLVVLPLEYARPVIHYQLDVVVLVVGLGEVLGVLVPPEGLEGRFQVTQVRPVEAPEEAVLLDVLEGETVLRVGGKEAVDQAVGFW